MNLQTRHSEKRFKTSNLEEMKGLFTAKRVIRSWEEDFVDEDNGAVVTIDRHEVIIERGVIIDDSILQMINFHISCGDITEVDVTNQQRCSVFHNNNQSIWVVTALIHNKKRNYLLYADSVINAFEIAIDYIEQCNVGNFGISSIKQYDSAYIIKENQERDFENEEDLDFYKIELKIEHEDGEQSSTFIVKTTDAESGKKEIEQYLIAQFTEEERDTDFISAIISAKKIPCESIIDVDFCERYFKTDKSE